MRRSAPPLIFLHGFLGKKEDWEGWFQAFEEEYFCVALDLPSHEEDMLEAVREEIGRWGQGVCVAYSLGGRVALQMQELFSGIVALSTHPGLVDEEERRVRLQRDVEWAEKLRGMEFEAFLREWYKQPVFDSLSEEEVEEMIERRKGGQDRDSLARMLVSLSLGQLPFREVSSKVAFVCGEKDWTYRKLYAKLPPEIEVRVVPGAGHAVHLEKPQETVRIVKELLDANRRKTECGVG